MLFLTSASSSTSALPGSWKYKLSFGHVSISLRIMHHVLLAYSLLQRYPTPIFRTKVDRLGTDKTIEALLLKTVSNPADHPTQGKGWGEQVGGQAETV